MQYTVRSCILHSFILQHEQAPPQQANGNASTLEYYTTDFFEGFTALEKREEMKNILHHEVHSFELPLKKQKPYQNIVCCGS